MWCVKCNNELRDCACPDIDERLAGLRGPDSNVVYRMCLVCGKHYSRCKCETPKWGLSTDDLSFRDKIHEKE